jgi:hypothetical protein
MANMTRRGLLKSTSVSVATLGVVASVAVGAERLIVAPTESHAVGAAPSTAVNSVSIVAYVRNAATGEIGVLVGEKEVIYRDPQVAASLTKAAGM